MRYALGPSVNQLTKAGREKRDLRPEELRCDDIF